MTQGSRCGPPVLGQGPGFSGRCRGRPIPSLTESRPGPAVATEALGRLTGSHAGPAAAALPAAPRQAESGPAAQDPALTQWPPPQPGRVPAEGR